jgi:threonine dehydrogenase-like Zn-dependent dehydrogenase
MYHLVENGGYLASPKQRDKMFEAAKTTKSLKAILNSIGAVTCSLHNFIIYELNADDPFKDTELSFGAIGVICENNNKRRIAMNVNQDQIQAIVQQVLAGMTQTSQAPKANAGGAIPATSRAAMLTKLENYEIKEFPIPELGDDDILVKVEGCGVCGTDAHEFKRDPFGLIPVVLGHEGTGEIVKMGKNVKKDSAGKPLNIGDKVVTCMIFKDNPDITMFDLNKQNVGGADVYGLLPDDDTHLNGWFADYIVVRGGSTVFNVSDLNLDMRILIEPSAVLIHAVERAKSTGILRFNSRVAVQGCGPIGLICIAILRTMGIENILAIDGEDKRLEFAKEMGASATVNFKEFKGQEALAEGVKNAFGGYYADFAFQCTGSPIAHSNIYKFIRSGGGLCELGFFINGGDATINPHFDICSKEITTVGSWVYTLRDYATTFDFLKRAKGIGLPLEKLITHRFPLSQINEAHKVNLEMKGLKIAIINE